MNAIETKNLVKKYGDLNAVNGININVKKGELVGFLGPNGAGKTTTISILSTIIKPTSGDAFIDGYSILKDPKEVRKQIAYIPQEIIIYDYLTAKENCDFFAKMHQIPKFKIQDQIKQLFNLLGLENKINTKASKLSGGMKRRLNLMIGLIMDPDVIFLDEPTAGLDPQSARLSWDFIRDLRNQGKTILLTTHNMHEAEELCDRIYIIDHGEIIAEGSPQDLRSNIGKGEFFDLKFKNGVNLSALKKAIEKLGDYINRVEILSDDRMVISANGGIKRFIEIEEILPDKLKSLENLNIHGNTLEDVFLILTGRALRG
jgi:ABC-2 type transport system ATP-binding protein